MFPNNSQHSLSYSSLLPSPYINNLQQHQQQQQQQQYFLQQQQQQQHHYQQQQQQYFHSNNPHLYDSYNHNNSTINTNSQMRIKTENMISTLQFILQEYDSSRMYKEGKEGKDVEQQLIGELPYIST